MSPENDHGRDGSFLTKIWAKLKNVTKAYLKNDHLRLFATTCTKFCRKTTIVLDGHWSLN